MGDECTCDKCQAGSVDAREAIAWPVAWASEAQAEGCVRAQRDLYIVVGEGGISLRQQTSEL